MKSDATKAFMAAVAVAQHHGRPHTPTDQAWTETLFSHVKGGGRSWSASVIRRSWSTSVCCS
ncbi:MAG: hypothetical protein M0T80_14095 [Actinomycetota bacterium]|nr:hypothetical protein [Actinomycetota bacterium]